jgi:hypothetical protein
VEFEDRSVPGGGSWVVKDVSGVYEGEHKRRHPHPARIRAQDVTEKCNPGLAGYLACSDLVSPAAN